MLLPAFTAQSFYTATESTALSTKGHWPTLCCGYEHSIYRWPESVCGCHCDVVLFGPRNVTRVSAAVPPSRGGVDVRSPARLGSPSPPYASVSEEQLHLTVRVLDRGIFLVTASPELNVRFDITGT